MSQMAFKSRAFITSTIAALLMTSTASAVTMTNRGDKEMKVSIVEGSAKRDFILAIGKVVDGVCQKGCIIRLNDDANDEYELQGSEVVSVEEGFLYYDGVDTGKVLPQRGSTLTGSEPKK